MSKPMTVAEAGVDDPLRKFLSGRRRSDRRACMIPVVLWSGRRRFLGAVVDLSMHGALVCVDDSALRSVVGKKGGGSYLEVVERYFGEGFQVGFPGHRTTVKASVVRLIVAMGEMGAMRIGCQFPTPLSPDEVGVLATGHPHPSRA